MLEVYDATLPAGARQALGDGAHEPGVGVADDEARAGEPAFAQPAQEPEPARMGLGVDGHDAEHAAHPVGADADGGDNRRGLHTAVHPALDVRGVQEQVREPGLPEVPGGQLRDPRVKRPAHRADLVLREPLYAHLPGDPLHLPRRDAVGPRFCDGRLGGAVRPRAPLDQAPGKYVPARTLRMRSTMSPTGGGEPALAVAVARGDPVLAGHVRLRVHDLVDHGPRERARQLPHVEEPVAAGGKSR